MLDESIQKVLCLSTNWNLLFYIKEWNLVIENILTLDELCIVIKNNRNVLSVLSNNFLSNTECIWAAMGNEVSNIKFADDLLKKDSEFALIVLKLHGEALEYLDESIKDNKEIVLEAVKNNYTAFEYCSESLRKDEDFICEAYKLNHNIMHFIDDKTIMQSKRLQDLNIDNKSREDDEDDLPF
jgi:DNA-directed RNA polymerase subunit L